MGASLVAGGFLPESMRGRRLDGLMHTCDWWATFAGLAGVSGVKAPGFMDPRSDQSASIPHAVKRVDSLDMWPYLSGQVQTSPRKVVHLSYVPADAQGALIVGRWKLVVGEFDAAFTWPAAPDSSKSRRLAGVSETNGRRRRKNGKTQCGTAGCLFDLQTDEGELN